MSNENFYKSAALSRNALSNEAIAARAYELWQQQGYPVGRDKEIWLDAERELLELRTPSGDLPETPQSSERRLGTAIPLREELPALPRETAQILAKEDVIVSPREGAHTTLRQELHADKDMHIGDPDTPYEAFAKDAPLATKVAQALRDRDDFGATAPGLTSVDPRV